jgi:FkbM family methyltransferase
MGANWANTLRLWHDMGKAKPGSHWEVYAFEASPLIQPYVEKFTQWLNGQGPKPKLVVPPAGSSGHLMKFAKRCGCSTATQGLMRDCMWKKFDAGLRTLVPDPALNRSELISARLAEARVASRNQTRYTFIPAAVGAQNGYLDLGLATPQQMIRGGAHSNKPVIPTRQLKTSETLRVHVVDVVSWLEANFRQEDYVFVKMDVECAEHLIIPALLETGAGRLIDKLAWECHADCRYPNRNKTRSCERTRTTLLQAAPGAKIISEGQAGFQGFDSFSSPSRYYPDC